MGRDIRDIELYREAESLYTRLRQPGSGQVSDIAELDVSPDGQAVVFSGTLADGLEGEWATRICRIDLSSGDSRVLTFGANTDRSARYAPDGRTVAFLSDRCNTGDFQLYLLDAATGRIQATPAVEGWVEYLQWSPDGARILLGVAGHGADVAGGQGAIAHRRSAQAVPSWMPSVDDDEESDRWRRAWLYDVSSNRVRLISPPQVNVWEAVWCGNETLAAVISPGPGERLWYSARLALLELRSGVTREIYAPADQLGWPSGSPSGRCLAFVEAVSSDRRIVAGSVRLIEVSSGKARPVGTQGVDITHTEWRSERMLLLAGHRGFEAVVGLYDAQMDTFVQTWSSREVSGGGHYLRISGINDQGDCVLAGESFTRAPEVAVIRHGEYRTVRSFDLGYSREVAAIEAVSQVEWAAPDGLEIQGWLLLPRGPAPYPLVMAVHGGPVWQWHPAWLGRARTLPYLLLIQHGYAVFFPNPRGSSGRGQDFARRVKGDLNGADTQDLLSGLDVLVERGIADAGRIGVTGISYGGCMTSWLITQDARFAAAVSVAPHTNQVSMHLLSNIPDFLALFLDDRYCNPGGRYFSRSPVMYAHKVATPTLNICGALDRCTPAEEAAQFHHALRECGVKSVLVTYPEEGHGIHKLPAAIDYAARMVGWFKEYIRADMPPRN